MHVTLFSGGKTDVFPSAGVEVEDPARWLEAHASYAPGHEKSGQGFVIFCRLRPGTDLTIAELNLQRATEGKRALTAAEEKTVRTRGYRNYAHVAEVTAFGIDYDEFPEEPPNWDPSVWPCDVYAHTTHNYDETNRPGKWRVILPLAVPLPIERELAVRKTLQRYLPRGAILRAPHQPAYLPTCPEGYHVEVVHVRQTDIPAALDWRNLPDLDMITAETVHVSGEAGGTLLGAEFDRRGLVHRDCGTKLDVVCPWAHEHKSGGELGYLYYTADGLGKFGCAHGACKGRDSTDVFELWWPGDGLPAPRDLTEVVSATAGEAETGLKTETPALQSVKHQAANFELMTVADFERDEPITWVIEGLVSVGEPTLIVGGAGSGKTSAMASLALSVATGRDVWGRFKTLRQGPIVHIDYEQGKTLRRTYRAFARGLGVDLLPLVAQGLLRVAPLPREQLLDANVTDKHLSDVGRELVALTRGASLCVVNSLTASTNKINENDAKVAAVFNLLTRVSEITGCAFVVLHHSGRAEGKTRARGSSAIDGAVQTVFEISHRKGDSHTVWEHTKDRPAAGQLEPFKLLWSGPGDVQTLVAESIEDEVEDAGAERPETRMQKSILFVMENRGLSGKDRILECVRGKKAAKRLVWDDMIVKGLIEHVGSRYLVAAGVVCPREQPEGVRDEDD